MLTSSKAWRALVAHQEQMSSISIRELFAQDSHRFERFSLRFDDLLLDYSKQRVVGGTMTLLGALAKQSGLDHAIEAMFAGERINHSEGRPVLHIALRNRSGRPIEVDGLDVMPAVQRVLGQMRALSDDIREGRWIGHTGKTITDVVNIGIGGSDLGPAMVCRALHPYCDGPRTHFVSNVDGTHLSEVLANLDAERTLFVVVSKTFTTQETLANARSARAWLIAQLETMGSPSPSDERSPSPVARHFIAVSTNKEKVEAFGIDASTMMEFWDWVGGRYSLWSAVGFTIVCATGMDNFETLLDGAHEMDEHFRTTPFQDNLPVTLALLGIWNANFFGARSQAIIPYDQSLEYFSTYFQQGDMESNGKRVDRDGNVIDDYHTGPILWGEPGTNGQHAFFQLLHQGTQFVPVDFIAPARSHHPLGNHHELLLANFFAQSEALMCGKSTAQARDELLQHTPPLDSTRVNQLVPHKTFPGDRPSNSLLFEKLTPRSLGRLLALYEHKIFVQGIIWKINSFDQWGVELGKQLATVILRDLAGSGSKGSHDSSTNGLIAHYKSLRVTATTR